MCSVSLNLFQTIDLFHISRHSSVLAYVFHSFYKALKNLISIQYGNKKQYHFVRRAAKHSGRLTIWRLYKGFWPLSHDSIGEQPEKLWWKNSIFLFHILTQMCWKNFKNCAASTVTLQKQIAPLLRIIWVMIFQKVRRQKQKKGAEIGKIDYNYECFSKVAGQICNWKLTKFMQRKKKINSRSTVDIKKAIVMMNQKRKLMTIALDLSLSSN